MSSNRQNKLEAEMSSYRVYHLTLGNRLTHFVGIPLIVFALFSALGWFRFVPLDIPLSASTFCLLGMFLFYFSIHKRVAGCFLIWSIPLYVVADEVSAMPFPISFLITGALFVIGWLLQLAGHAVEKNRPAFFTNLNHLWRGPLFITYEGMKIFGIKV